MSNLASIMFVAMGANQGSPAGMPEMTLRQAVLRLEARGAVIRSVSEFYETPCFPAGAGPDYVNAALVMSAPWSPTEALAQLHAVEHEFGRARVQRWGQRTLDLDLLAYEDLVAPDLAGFEEWRDLDPDLQKMRAPDQLILPHPRLQDRAFVLVPLADVAPDWVHPVSQKSVREMLGALDPDLRAEVKPLPQK